MTQRNRKRFDPAFKARVALAAMQERESLAQLGKKFGVHPVLVGQWKKQLLEKAEEEARQKAQAQGKKAEEAVVDPKAQRNFTDPESRIMPRDGSFQQSYNAQVAVDADTQLILAQEVGQSLSDMRQLEPMVSQVEANTGLVPQQLSADSGYLCREDIEKVQAKGVEPFVAVGRTQHGQEPESAARGRMPKGLSFKQRMGRKLSLPRFCGHP
jgi:transposase-like protein